MKRFESREGSSVTDMISQARLAAEETPMNREEIQRSLREAGQLVVALSGKVPSFGEAGSFDQEVGERGSSATNLLPTSERVGSIAADTRKGVLGHVDVTDENSFGPAERSDSYLGHYRTERAQGESDVSLLPNSPTQRERTRRSESPEEYFSGDHRDTSSSEYFARGGDSTRENSFTSYESPKDRMQRLIDEAAKLLNDPMWSADHDDLYSDETLEAIRAARGAIDALKYPGGFSKNPLKAATTLRNVFRFVGDFHKKELYAAEEELYPLVIDRAVARVKAKGAAYNKEQIAAEAEAIAKQLLPKSFQHGGGWRNDLKRQLGYALHASERSSVSDDFFAS